MIKSGIMGSSTIRRNFMRTKAGDRTIFKINRLILHTWWRLPKCRARRLLTLLKGSTPPKQNFAKIWKSGRHRKIVIKKNLPVIVTLEYHSWKFWVYSVDSELYFTTSQNIISAYRFKFQRLIQRSAKLYQYNGCVR